MIKFVTMILITGGTGLVGGHLLLRLAGGTTALRALYHNEKNISKTKKLFSHHGKSALFETIDWVQGDITDVPSLEEAFKGVTQVYHCAANMSFDPGDEAILRKVNIEGTANMVNCALSFSVEKFCHVSSIAALGDPLIAGSIITEETEWNPEVYHSDYQISKYGAEMEVWRGWQEGLKVVIVNPGLIFGYGYWEQGSSAVLKSVKKGQSFYTTGNVGIVAVEDVAEIMVRLMESSHNAERYTLVAENIDFKSLLDTVAKGMNKRGPVIYASKLMLAFAWRIDWLLAKLLMRKRLLTKHMAQTAYTTEPFDNGKVTRTLAYKFMDMKPYLEKLAAAYLKQ